MNKSSGFIVGAYTCAPSFHQHSESMEKEFWKILSDNPNIRGIEQPCSKDLHILGDDFLFSNTPSNWEIVITAVAETTKRRHSNADFGLASENEEQRRECINYYQHLYDKIQRINDRFGIKKILALEIQSAPALNLKLDQAKDSFKRSLQEISQWDWPCELIVEHCDAYNGVAPVKGFLPLEDEIQIINELKDIQSFGICINWGRSVLEQHDINNVYQHIKQSQQNKLLKALMFSGTTISGPYGNWGDLHAPFAPFLGSKTNCTDSLMTVESAQKILTSVDINLLSYIGIKLLEINKDADNASRIAIIEDGIDALLQASL